MATLKEIATNGTVDNWDAIKIVIQDRISQVAEEYDEMPIIVDPLTGSQHTFPALIQECKQKLSTDFNESPPFTIQRLAELLEEPTIYYAKSRPDKLVWALASMVSVSNDDYPKIDFDEEMKKDAENNKSGSKAVSGVTLTSIPWAVDTKAIVTGRAVVDEVDTGIIQSAIKHESTEPEITESDTTESDTTKSKTDAEQQST